MPCDQMPFFAEALEAARLRYKAKSSNNIKRNNRPTLYTRLQRVA